jgi:hypothetical protein
MLRVLSRYVVELGVDELFLDVLFLAEKMMIQDMTERGRGWGVAHG